MPFLDPAPSVQLSFTLGRGFSTATLVTFGGGGREFSVVRGGPCCAVHCSVVSSVPGLYPSGAGSTQAPPAIVTAKNASRYYQIFPGGQTWLQLRTSALRKEKYATSELPSLCSRVALGTARWSLGGQSPQTRMQPAHHSPQCALQR